MTRGISGVINRKRRSEGYKAAAVKIKNNFGQGIQCLSWGLNWNVSNMCVRRVNAVKEVTLIDCLTDCLAGWLAGWLNDWLAGWLTGWMTGWLIDWRNDWLAGWLTRWINGWLNDWLANWLAEWLAGWLIEWLADWLAGWLIGWLTDDKSQAVNTSALCQLLDISLSHIQLHFPFTNCQEVHFYFHPYLN